MSLVSSVRLNLEILGCLKILMLPFPLLTSHKYVLFILTRYADVYKFIYLGWSGLMFLFREAWQLSYSIPKQLRSLWWRMELGNLRWHVRTWHMNMAKDNKAVVAFNRAKDNKATEAHRSRSKKLITCQRGLSNWWEWWRLSWNTLFFFSVFLLKTL